MKKFIKQTLSEGLAKEVRVKFNLPISSDIQQIQSVFKKNNFKLYIVGGAVRDAIMNKVPKDFDLTTDALPDQVEQIMTAAGFRTIPTGKAFGVINVFTEENEYEIATFRSDGEYTDNRRPDSVTFGDVIADSKRRDLTINALFYDIETKEIIDLVGGISDIKNGIIRTVGKSEDRFGEDRLRILRIIRFAGRFGNDISDEADLALRKDSSLEGISGERIRDEFIKGIKSAKSVKQFLLMLDRYNLFDWVLKGLTVNKKFIDNSDPMIVISTLLIGNDFNSLSKKLNGLKYPSDEVSTIVFLNGLLKLSVKTAFSLKKTQKFSKVTKEQIQKFGEFNNINSKILNAFLQFELSVSGGELITKMSLKSGPEVGIMVQKIETENFTKLMV
jgi:tRNA nucleotidyltransferase (CCA-adding enzyme)